jgi:valyl-tRNA synthetase
MIIAGYEYRKEKPFTNVYLTGIVRDKKGRKMSKQLGNSPEPLELIQKYSADGVRVGMLLCSPAGNDLLFEESYCEQGRNFANKIWNAFRLIKGWEVGEGETPERNQVAIDWFNSKLNAEIENINDLFSKYRISEALMATYKLVWDDFCSWYLEMVKPDFVDGEPLPVDSYTYNSTVEFFEDLLKLLHPFMPFISEELWHLINERDEEDCIIISEMPEGGKYDSSLLAGFDKASQVITEVRTVRKQKNISNKEKISLFVKSSSAGSAFDAVVMKLCNLSEIKTTKDKVENSVSFLIGQDEYFIPFGSSIDLDAERQRLEQELEYNKGFLVSVQKKLSNERFIQSAKPEVVENEKKKQSDAEAKIRAIEERLASLQ